MAEEAAALLKELQQRTKEQPDAYKKPMYVGIYQVGPQQRSLSGKQIEELDHLSGRIYCRSNGLSGKSFSQEYIGICFV